LGCRVNDDDDDDDDDDGGGGGGGGGFRNEDNVRPLVLTAASKNMTAYRVVSLN
jgi:hypothetical protein